MVSSETLYPWWLAPIFLALAIFISWLLYARRNRSHELPVRMAIILSISRALIILIIGFLIISPFIRLQRIEKQIPEYIIAIDNSKSILNNPDSVQIRESILQKISELEKGLKQGFNVKTYLFGESVRTASEPDFSDPYSNYEQFVRRLPEETEFQPVAGALVIGDGIVNVGVDPDRIPVMTGFPVHVIAVGDSEQKRDLGIQEVICNKYVRKGSDYPVKVYFKSSNWIKQSALIQILKAGKVIAEKKMDGDPALWPASTEFTLHADTVGEISLIAKISSSYVEANQINNTKRFRVKVTENEGKVLALYAGPHPDISAISEVISLMNGVNIEEHTISEFKGSFSDYSLIILHAIPSVDQPVLDVMEASGKESIPMLLILNAQSDLDLISRYSFGARMSKRIDDGELIQGYVNPNFSLFNLPEGMSEQILNWPPLEGPLLQFDQYDPSGSLFLQSIKGINLQEPLIQVARSHGVRYGFIFGEGIWQWRIYDFLENEDHFYFNSLFTQLIQYLLQDEMDDRLSIVFPERIIEGSTFEVNAYLYNSVMESVNDPEMKLEIQDSLGNQLNYQMGRSSVGYQLTLSNFSSGIYKYEVSADPGDGVLSRTGLFEVDSWDFETMNQSANFRLLNRLALVNKGEFFTINDWNSVMQFVRDLKPEKSSTRQVLKWYEPVDIWWLLLLIIGLLAFEWIVRRWYGIR